MALDEAPTTAVDESALMLASRRFEYHGVALLNTAMRCFKSVKSLAS